MKKLIFLVLTGIFVSSISSADIGRIETKRERMEKEYRESRVKSVSDAYLKIHENFLREDYTEVDRLADGYLSGGLSKPNSEDVLYLQALSLLKLKRGDEARVKLRDLENTFTVVNRKASASASIADSYFYEGNYGPAYKAYQETLRKYPNSDQTTYALYKLKELSAKLGKPPVKDPVNHFLSIEETPFFTIQVGAFSKIRNANALMNKLIHQRFDAFVVQDTQTNTYRVRVGRLSNKDEASLLEGRLKREGYPTKIIP